MKRLSIVISIAALILPLGLMAEQHEERAALSDVWVVVPKPGMGGQFEAAVPAHMAKCAEQGDARTWAGFRTVVGYHIGDYQFRACCFDWADQDAYDKESMDKGFGADWNENVHPYVDHYHHYIDQMDWENSHWPDGDGNGPYYGVTTWTRKEGGGAASEQAREKLSQIALTEGWAEQGNTWLWHTRMGGKPTLMIVNSFASYAEMAPPEPNFFEYMVEQMGSAEDVTALFDEFGSGFSSSDFTVWMYVPELSTPSEEE